MTDPKVEDVRERLVSSWTSAEEATTVPHQSGGVVLRAGLSEVGHLHPDGVLHVFFPRPVRDQLVRDGVVEPHRNLSDSGWVTFRLHSVAELPKALDLLRLARDAQTAGGPAAEPECSTPSASGAPVTEKQIDESSAESFPASDPPAVSHET